MRADLMLREVSTCPQSRLPYSESPISGARQGPATMQPTCEHDMKTRAQSAGFTGPQYDALMMILLYAFSQA